ncbi:MAG: hypothetical protein Cons2KO_06630 [Congregibacter sp.]
MKRLTLTFKTIATALFTTLWCTSPVWGDDTEIFFGDVAGSDTRPNVMFIIDTSGSMGGNVAGTGKDRLDNVKDALYQLLDELANVNVGLMRFTNPGGPVLYPVKYIDEEIEDDPIVSLDIPIAAAEDDAQEFDGSGLMVLDGENIQVVDLTTSNIETFRDQVADVADDSEEAVSGANVLTYPDSLFNGSETVAVRFTGSEVPRGATITNAFLRFTGNGSGDSNPVYYTIVGQVGAANAFTATNNDITSRPTTLRSASWAITGTVVNGQTVDTPSLVGVVEDIIADPAWDPVGGGVDDMVFILAPDPTQTSTGSRFFFSRDASAANAPELVIEYSTGGVITSGITRTGLRFQATNIPRGATVTEARITFTADRDFTDTYDLNIAVEETGDSAAFTSTAGNIAGRSYSATTVPWAGTISATQGETFQTPDLAGIINPVASDGAWCGGNAMTFVIRGTDGSLPAWAFDGDASQAPRLQVQYDFDTIPIGSSCFRRTISRTIAESSDDAEETSSSATTTSGDLDFFAGSDVGVRFQNVGIPRNATIFESYLEFVADAGDSGTTNMSITVDASDDAAGFTGTIGTISGRTYAPTAIPWSETDPWVLDDVIRTPDVSDLVRAVTSRTGWDAGNAMAFRIQTSTSTDREAESINGSAGEAPRFVAVFQDDGSGLTKRTVRTEIAELVSQLNHNGWTPIQDTLYEAALYYTGSPVQWGATRGVSGIDGGPFSYARISAEESMIDGTYSISRPSGCTENNLDAAACRNERINSVGIGATYDSPIDDFCQEQSHIILLTDGAANRPHSADLIPTFTGQACANEPTENPDGSTTNLSAGERCVKDLAKYLNENDQRPTLTGLQRVTTHTIGFNFSSKWLEDVATAGGGVYKTADNATELVDQIKEIIGEVLTEDSTFVAPVAAVNEFNQLSHLNQVYFAVFRPDEFPRWRGNLKRYTLGEEGGVILDANGNLAIDSSTGFFQSNSQSFWSSTIDGADVDRGGAAENTPAYTSRNVYTYFTGSTSTNLANSVNSIASTNTALTKTMFDVGGLSDADFATHLDWIRGQDVDDEDGDGNTTEDRYVYGDPLHSRPVAVTYGGTEENPDVEIFFGTNSGAIQAVNATTGAERFAFFPEATLPMQVDLRANEASTPHPYGIDGTVTPWTNDESRDGISAADAEDFVRIYTGMRRGGRNYYALDVTDRANPEIMWQIRGGEVQPLGDFRELGQTWSRPIKTRIAVGGVEREVLIFSAGYDETQDDAQLRAPDSVGRGMYIVDAVTGTLIWSGGKTGAQSWTESFSAMDYSFPSTMSVVDINQDGFADMWFAADTGGQLWRFDIRNGESLANLITGGVIADLGVAGGTNSIETNRRFFASPSVALVRGPDGPELAIAIGSGFRPSPLSILATNRMYMIRQSAVFSAPSSYNAVTEANLYDATANTLATATGTTLAEEQDLLYAAQGWFFDLSFPGEKVLSSPLIANDRVIFTTYTPGSSGVWCVPAAGTSRAYSVQLEDAVRTEPRPLLTPSIVDQATIIVPPPYVPDPNDPDDGPDPNDPNDPDSPCPNGNSLVIKLNAEDGPIDDWCNDATKTYWVQEQ